MTEPPGQQRSTSRLGIFLLFHLAILIPIASLFVIGGPSWWTLRRQPIWEAVDVALSTEGQLVVMGIAGTRTRPVAHGSWWIAFDPAGQPLLRGWLDETLNRVTCMAPGPDNRILVGGDHRDRMPSVIDLDPATGVSRSVIEVATGKGRVSALAAGPSQDLLVAGIRGGTPFIERQQADGTTTWWQTIEHGLISAVDFSAGDALLAISQRSPADHTTMQPGLIRIDEAGAVQPPQTPWPEGNALALASTDTGLLIAGRDGTPDQGQAKVAWSGQTGADWTRSHGPPGSVFHAALAWKDGWMLAGSRPTDTGDRDAWVVHIDAAGTVRWEQLLGGPGDDSFQALSPSSRGELIAVGQLATDDGPDAWVVALDDTGKLVWKRSIRGFLPKKG